MGTGPAPFSDIGKRARDLLTKDYNFDHKFTLSTTSGGGLGVTATGTKVDELFIGDIASQFKSGNTTVDVKVDTNSNVLTTITANDLIHGTKTALSFRLPDHKSGKLDVQYLHNQVAINSTIGLTPAPLLNFAGTIGNQKFSMGGEVGFDTATATVTKYNTGIGFNQEDFSAALILADKGQTLKASYIHVLNPKTGNSVAAEMIHRLDTRNSSFTIGSSLATSPSTMLKTRFSDSGRLAVSCQHQWRPKSLATLSAEYDPKSIHSPSKVGLALALK